MPGPVLPRRSARAGACLALAGAYVAVMAWISSTLSDGLPMIDMSVVTRYEDPHAHAVRERYLDIVGGPALPVPVEAIAEDLLASIVRLREGRIRNLEAALPAKLAEIEKQREVAIGRELVAGGVLTIEAKA